MILERDLIAQKMLSWVWGLHSKDTPRKSFWNICIGLWPGFVRIALVKRVSASLTAQKLVPA